MLVAVAAPQASAASVMRPRPEIREAVSGLDALRLARGAAPAAGPSLVAQVRPESPCDAALGHLEDLEVPGEHLGQRAPFCGHGDL